MFIEYFDTESKAWTLSYFKWWMVIYAWIVGNLSFAHRIANVREDIYQIYRVPNKHIIHPDGTPIDFWERRELRKSALNKPPLV